MWGTEDKWSQSIVGQQTRGTVVQNGPRKAVVTHLEYSESHGKIDDGNSLKGLEQEGIIWHTLKKDHPDF